MAQLPKDMAPDEEVSISSRRCCTSNTARRLTLEEGGGGESGTQKFVYQKIAHWPVAYFVFSHYRANPNYLRNPNFCVRCFELIICKIFATAPKIGENYCIVAFFFRRMQFCRVILAH